MKNCFFAVLLLALSAIPCISQTVAEGVPASQEGREIFTTIAKWADAVRDRDIKALDSLFEEDLIVTTGDGRTHGKKEELESMKPVANLRTVSIKNDDIKVRIFGQAAVATALNGMHLVIAGKDVRMSFRYTAVFVNKDGRWQLAALQITTPVKSPGKS